MPLADPYDLVAILWNLEFPTVDGFSADVIFGSVAPLENGTKKRNGRNTSSCFSFFFCSK
jgi:hypothetical protein